MDGKGTLEWENARGKTESREINYVIDILDHLGEPGFALLAIAANTHLSVSDLRRLLIDADIGRSRSYIQRRRWLFQKPDAVNSPGKPNRDGKDARAVAIMARNETLSVRQLALRRELNEAVNGSASIDATDNTPPIEREIRERTEQTTTSTHHPVTALGEH